MSFRDSLVQRQRHAPSVQENVQVQPSLDDKRDSSSISKASPCNSYSWMFSSPLWRTVIGTPLLLLGALPAAMTFAKGPLSFYKSHDRSKVEIPNIMDGLESKFVHVNGIKLHVMATAPSPGKPLMLFLHGFPEFWYSWRHQLKHFSKDYQVAALDMRGYNLSDKPQGAENYTVDKVSSDVKEVVYALGHEKCVLIGHDWGAAIAWGTATLFPEVVDKVVAMGAPPLGHFMRRMSLSQAFTSSYMLMFTVAPHAVEVVLAANDFDFVRQLLVREVGMPPLTEEDIERYKQALQRPGALHAAVSYYIALWSITAQHPHDPINRRLLESQVLAPALMLFADRDMAFKPELLQGLQSTAPNVTTKMLHARHFMLYETPEQVNTAIEEWLKSAENAT